MPANRAPALDHRQKALPPVNADNLRRALDAATDPPEVLKIEAELDRGEKLMRDSGLFSDDEIRPVNETRMRARWKLGQLLAKMDRDHGPGRGKKMSADQTSFSFRAYLTKIGLDKDAAMKAQRTGTLPESELEKALAWCHKENVLCTFALLIERARPWWYQVSRKRKHLLIVANARMSDAPVGPFPLIYADPPWKFEVYSEKGLERTPDQHYPTLTDDEIKGFKVGDRFLTSIIAPAAACLLWCTSSNLVRALSVLEAWGFTYKASAVWVKDRTGTGLVFRNKHEMLLYGTRGEMPGPQWQPDSAWLLPRGEHSAKPAEIRSDIEKMYPDFDEHTRLELFARERVPGWTSYGYETDRDAAA